MSEEICAKLLTVPVFRLQKKNFGFLMSFSHGEEKVAWHYAFCYDIKDKEI